MLAIEKSKSHKGKCTPNILPCRINHNGSVSTSKRYWNPVKISDGKIVSYFRGRKLHGRATKLPASYKGVVVSSTERSLPKSSASSPQNEDEDAEEALEVKIMDEQAEFDDILVWGHEALPDEVMDPYVRGVEEWIGFAEEIHCYDEEPKSTSK